MTYAVGGRGLSAGRLRGPPQGTTLLRSISIDSTISSNIRTLRPCGSIFTVQVFSKVGHQAYQFQFAILQSCLLSVLIPLYAPPKPRTYASRSAEQSLSPHSYFYQSPASTAEYLTSYSSRPGEYRNVLASTSKARDSRSCRLAGNDVTELRCC